MSATEITLESFPYRRDWQQEEFDEILARKDLLVEAMTDALGPTGQMLWLPADIIHILAFHLAFAGGTVEDRLAWIVSKPYEPPPPSEDDDKQVDGTGRIHFEGLRHWVLKENYQPGPPDPDETTAMATAAAEKIRRQLTPAVTEALTAILADQFKKHSPEPITRLDKAEATVTEADLRESVREDGER